MGERGGANHENWPWQASFPIKIMLSTLKNKLFPLHDDVHEIFGLNQVPT
jgi:hypothetical protein